MLQRREFDLKEFVIPAGVLGKLVVGNDVSPLLCLAKVIEHDNRYPIEIQFASGEQPSMSGYDPRWYPQESDS